MDIMKIGAFIKTQRTELNLTQKELAEKIGCTDKAISRWETGKGLPDMSFIIPLSKELNVSINELLMGERLITEAETPEEAEKVTEIIKKNDETLVGVIEETQKTIKHHSRISSGLLILLILQMVIFFIIPNFIPNSFAPFETMLALSALVSVFAGFIKNKFKWLFPVAISLVFFLVNLFYRTEEGFLGFVLSLYFAGGSAIIIAVSSLIAFIYRKLKDK